MSAKPMATSSAAPHAPTIPSRPVPDPLAAEAVVELLSDLVRIPSTNPAIAPDEAHGEGAIADFACGWLLANGIRAWKEDAAPGRPNVVAEVGDAGPALILYGHLDTVGTAGMTIPPFEPRVEAGRLYGRGATDMKGGVAACMAAAAALARERLPGRIRLALVADEEYESVGAADFVRRHRADGCIVSESSEGDLILAHKGFVWADITTRGRAAHGSRFDLGVSAIARMGRIIAALDRFDADTLRSRTAPLVGAASMHCALVRGGVGLSTYAPECSLSIERRMLPGETGDQVEEELKRVIREAGEEGEVSIRTVRNASRTPADSPLAVAVRDAARAVTGKLPRDKGAPYWMDSALFAEAGIPTVNYGPTGASPHEAVEWVDVASVVACAAIYVEASRRFWGAS
jgi:acetylornithine deacetylase/succinyl-diaminopimelate desuccinylase-like protein